MPHAAPRVAGSVRVLRALLGVAIALALLGLLAVRCGSLDGMTDEARATRLLRWRGDSCAPKIVEHPEEGVLRVVCADGKHRFRAQPSCDEDVACWLLGIDVACWDYEPD